MRRSFRRTRIASQAVASDLPTAVLVPFGGMSSDTLNKFAKAPLAQRSIALGRQDRLNALGLASKLRMGPLRSADSLP